MIAYKSKFSIRMFGVALSSSDSASVALGISEKANNNVIASYTVMISTILSYIVAKIIRSSSGAFLLKGNFRYNSAKIYKYNTIKLKSN